MREIPNIGDNAAISSQTDKIDNAPSEGLAGTPDSVGYRVEEIEKHFHNRERWRGMLAVQTATNWADDNVDTPYQVISGANTWGVDTDDEAQVFGTADTPIIAGTIKFDPFRISITNLSSDTPYKLRMIWGTGTMADAITAEQYSELIVENIVTGSKSGGAPTDFRMPRLNSGVDKVWVQAWNETDNATCDFFVGIHEYTG